MTQKAKTWGVILACFGIAFVSYHFLTGKLRCELYWMPHCPYGQEALRSLFAVGASEKGFDSIELNYIANEHSAESGVSSSPVLDSSPPSRGCQQATLPKRPDFRRFSSLHGRTETEEAIRQVMICKQWPSQWKAYLRRFIENPSQSWKERCQMTGIPFEKVEKLMASDQADAWFSKNIRRSRDRGIMLSPTLAINGRVVSSFPKSADQLRSMLCLAGVLKPKKSS